MPHYPLDPSCFLFCPNDSIAVVQKELPDELSRLFILVAEDAMAATGSDDSMEVESILLEVPPVLPPPLLHVVLHSQMHEDDDDDDGNLTVTEHLDERLYVCCAAMEIHPALVQNETDSARPLPV